MRFKQKIGKTICQHARRDFSTDERQHCAVHQPNQPSIKPHELFRLFFGLYLHTFFRTGSKTAALAYGGFLRFKQFCKNINTAVPRFFGAG
jgi:hypothetical protein